MRKDFSESSSKKASACWAGEPFRRITRLGRHGEAAEPPCGSLHWPNKKLAMTWLRAQALRHPERAENAIRYSGKVEAATFSISRACRTKTWFLRECADRTTRPVLSRARASSDDFRMRWSIPGSAPIPFQLESRHPYHTWRITEKNQHAPRNINWMHARQAMFESDLFAMTSRRSCRSFDGRKHSAMFDNCLELLVLADDRCPRDDDMIPEP